MVNLSVPVDALSTTFAALADPTRRAILARLMAGEATVSELAEPFRISLAGISKHLKVLERAGLVERSREAQWRPCQLDARPLAEASAWLEGYRQFWEDRFRRLEDVLEEMKARERERERTQRQKRSPNGKSPGPPVR